MKKLQQSKVLLVAVLALLIGSSDLLAQGRGGRGADIDPEKRATEDVTEMAQAIGLSAEQVDQIKPLLVANLTKQNEMRKQMRDSGDRGSIREKMGDLRDEYMTSLGDILSEDQMTKYKAFEKEKNEARRQMRRGGRPGNRGTL